jgi:hypothetical protein
LEYRILKKYLRVEAEKGPAYYVALPFSPVFILNQPVFGTGITPLIFGGLYENSD